MENKKNKITIPQAIIVAGFLIMMGILLTKYDHKTETKAEPKTLSEQVGVSKEDLSTCLQNMDLQDFYTKTMTSAENAMKGVPSDGRGTPYSVVITKNGLKSQIRGAMSYENLNTLISDLKNGKVGDPYTGEINIFDENDHVLGNKDADIVIVEYSDLECLYCKKFHEVLKKVVAESNGNVAWVYRHWPISSHQYSFEKAVASECITKLKGEDSFWKYVDLIFGLMDEEKPSVVDQL